MRKILLAVAATFVLALGAGVAQAHDPYCNYGYSNYGYGPNVAYYGGGYGGGYGYNQIGYGYGPTVALRVGYGGGLPYYGPPVAYRPYGYGYSGGYYPYQAGRNVNFRLGW